MIPDEGDYDPNNWHWDPHDHLPVYVHKRRWVSDSFATPDQQTEYAFVSYPEIDPECPAAMISLSTKWMAATDLSQIRNLIEPMY